MSIKLDSELKKKILERKKDIDKYNSNPKITLIMQFFNHGNLVKLHAERIKKNALIEEVIICEDGSSDNSLELWHKYLSRRNDIIIRSNDFHEIRSYNRAAKYSNGEYLCFCQDDDLLPCNNIWLKNALSLFDTDPKLGIIGCLSGDEFKNNNEILEPRKKRTWYASDRIIKNNGKKIMTKLNEIIFRYSSSVNIGPIIIKKNVFDTVNGWTEKYSKPGQPGIGLDFDLSFKCWKNGFRVGCMPIDINLCDNIIDNKLKDEYFYYRYGFRGSCVIDESKERCKQFTKNNKILLDTVNSYGANFLSDTYNEVQKLNGSLKKI